MSNPPGLDEVLKKLERLGKMEAVKATMKAVGLYMKGKVSIAPPVKRLARAAVYGETFFSPQQRGFFFGALDAGVIEVPYVRNSSPGSESITKRWTNKVSQDGMSVTIGNNASYALLLHGSEEEQSKYAEEVGWKRADQTVEEEEPKVYEMLDSSLRKECEA